MVRTCEQIVVFLNSSTPYIRSGAQSRAQVAVGHVGRDDERRFVVIEADADQRQHVGVLECGHDEAFV